MVTGHGLAGAVRRFYPRWVLWVSCGLLLFSNIINIGADLGGMAEATEMVTGINSMIWTPVYTVLIVSLLFWSSYRHIARVFKWLTLVLFAYIAAAFLARPDWSAVIRDIHSAYRMVAGISCCVCRHYGDHHFAISVFLASRTGGRAGTCGGPFIGSTTGSNRQRTEEFLR